MLTRPRPLFIALLAVSAMLHCAAAGAQVLARPGWTGSGITTEPWWRSAVFYRIAPEHFQDSDGDGVGDLRGIAERLDYLQALGIDAIVLQLPFDETGFDDLLAEANRRHVRLVIGLDRTGGAGLQAGSLEAQARQWLSRGAAGILLPPPPAGMDSAAEDALRRSLRRSASEYPGERVVIASPLRSLNGASALHLGKLSLRQDSPQLILSPLPVRADAGDATASTMLAALTQPPPADGAPLLELSPPSTNTSSGTSSTSYPEIAAALLLTQRSAVLLDYGEELGLPAPLRMPWTPTNITPPPVVSPSAAEPSPPASSATVYGPYRPYIPPPPKPKVLTLPPPSEPTLPDPDTLPGFSTQTPPPDEPLPAVQSVALQERNPHSLLTLYRELLALHHGNATLRSGSLVVLREGDGVAVWLRRAPAGARTVASVIVAANCGDRPVTLALANDFAQLHLRPGELHSLLPGASGTETMNSTHLTLAPHAIFIGELYHSR